MNDSTRADAMPSGETEMWPGPAARRPALGGWAIIPDALVAEIMARAGYDWVCLDCQHGLIDRAASLAMLRALDGAEMPALVRVSRNDAAEIAHALDGGAAGVIVPMVNTADEARRAAAWAKYPPVGERSWGPIRASLVRPHYTPAAANAGTVCLVMIETPEAVRNIEAILGVPGVDGVFIGPSDLRLSTHGQVAPLGDDDESEAAIERVVAACRAASLHVGLPCGDAEDVRRRTRQGFTLLSLPSDYAVLTAALAREVAEATDGAPDPAVPHPPDRPRKLQP